MKVVITAALAIAGAALASPTIAKETRTPILVELFTSEGCNDCPPANRLLTELSEKQPIPGAYVVALSEHVDYFNRPWVDPFSSHQFTVRQSAFANVLKLSEVYTPQLVVDGRAECLGNDHDAVTRTVAAAAGRRHASVDVSTNGGDHVTVRVSGVDAVQAKKRYLCLALTEDGLSSHVTSGENAGHTLTHSGVVRSLVKVGPVADGEYQETVTVSPQWRRGPLHVIAFVQNVDTGAVDGTGIADL